MNIVDQRVIDMTLEEFKMFKIPEGYRMSYLSGEEKLGRPGALDTYFMIHVVLRKEK